MLKKGSLFIFNLHGIKCGTIASKINITTKGVYLPISKIHSILAVANLLAHNNISQICYCGQISLQSAAVSCSFSDNLTPLGVTYILLVHGTCSKNIMRAINGNKRHLKSYCKSALRTQEKKNN